MVSTQNAIVEVTDLVAHYGDRAVLNEVNLTVQTGTIHVIMGRSGSGKARY